MRNYLKQFSLLLLSCLAVSACAMDDQRLVGRWTEVNSLSCDAYKEVSAVQPISMLRFNQNGDWALSYQDGQLIFKGTYTAQPAAEGAADFSGQLQLVVEEGVYDPAHVKLEGNYSVEENYLILHDIWLDRDNAPLCGHSFKRR